MDCRACHLREITDKYGWCQVEGRGNTEANILLVGEAISEGDAKQGKPFVGVEGKLLYNILFSIGLNSDDVYITNVVCCRPIKIEKDVDESDIIKNRPPSEEEVDNCKSHLYNKIGLMNPYLIIALGKVATDWFFPKIVLERGLVYRWKHGDKIYRILPLFHPAALLYNSKTKRAMDKHLKDNMEIIKTAKEFNNG